MEKLNDLSLETFKEAEKYIMSLLEEEAEGMNSKDGLVVEPFSRENHALTVLPFFFSSPSPMDDVHGHGQRDEL